jgi:hypothetical protein
VFGSNRTDQFGSSVILKIRFPKSWNRSFGSGSVLTEGNRREDEGERERGLAAECRAPQGMADGSGRWGRGLTDVGRRGAPRAASAGRRIVSPRPVLQVVAGVGAVDGGRAADARRGERGGRARRATQGGQGWRDTIGEAGCVIG